MTTLSNANLLDDSVANSVSLKNQRLNKTARTAKNPQPLQEEEEEEETDTNEVYNNTQDADVYDRTATKNADMKKEKDNDDNTILGMNPAMFYTVLAVVAIVGGVVVYNKFFKKGKSLPSPDLGSPAAASTAS